MFDARNGLASRRKEGLCLGRTVTRKRVLVILKLYGMN